MSPRTRIGCTLYEMSRANLVRAVPAPREWSRRRRASARRYAAAALVVCLGLPVAGCYWPRSSTLPVPRLEHPAFDVATAGLQPPFRFAVFGDQKGLASSGEWDALLRDLRSLDPPPAFLLDTGDIVENGVYRDQFVRLERILSVVNDLPYLLAVGNHEIDNDDQAAKGHVVEFLGGVIGRDAFRVDQLYYVKTVGSLRLLVLDSNDLVYPERGACTGRYPAGSRRARPVSDPMRAFAARGWDMSGWEGVSQGAVMPSGSLVNQFGLVTLTADGELECVIHHVHDSRPRPCYP